MKIIIAMCVMVSSYVAVSTSDTIDNEWELFKAQHGKVYLNMGEDMRRMKVYMENRDYIARHNMQYEKGEVMFTMKINKFGDLTHKEFLELTGQDSIHHVTPIRNELDVLRSGREDAPTEWDWRDKGAVTPVRSLGACGAPWAISAAGAIESRNFIKHGVLPYLSVQNLIDCVGPKKGCGGKLPLDALSYVLKNRGIDSEDYYPFEDDVKECRYRKEGSAAFFNLLTQISPGEEVLMKEILAESGPVSVVIDASQTSMQFYSGGVYYDPNCTTNGNLGALAVGYGVEEDGTKYWLIRNSWGTNWGEEGYLKIARDRHSHCGVASDACFPSEFQ